MQLEVKYQCDVCSNSFLLDFNKALMEKKMKCSNCGVKYNFSEEELDEFAKCYQKLINRLKHSNGENQTIS